MTALETLSRIERDFYAILDAAARKGEVCPSNTALADRMGFNSTATACRYIDRLVDAELITVQRGSHSRIVTILATGMKTAGTITKPHWRDVPRSNADILRAQAQREARGREDKFKQARKLSGTRHITRADVTEPVPNYVNREPCFACQVPRDRHDELGCKRWRPRP